VKTIYKAYKFKLEPNNSQKELLHKHFGSCRFIYNYYLNLRKENYLNNKTSLNYYDNSKDLTLLRKKEEYIWLNEINAQSLQQSLRHLDTAYNRFFRKQGKFPRFKKKSDRQSFIIPQSIILKNNKLFIAKFREGISLNLYKAIEGKILFATISKSPVGKYYVSITCEVQYEPYSKTNSKIGIDTGIKDLAILSDGKIYKNIKVLKTNLKKIKYNHRQLSKKVKGSKSRLKQQNKLGRIHENVTNIRLDYLHKVSTEIVKNHDVICIEDLAVKNLMKNHKLSQAFSDVALGTFYNMLTYKANWNDKTVVKIDRWFPSSKTCSNCGYINQDLTLSIREWVCPDCGIKHDRDLNASKNILIQGLNVLSGSGIESDTKQKQVESLSKGEAMKPEAN